MEAGLQREAPARGARRRARWRARRQRQLRAGGAADPGGLAGPLCLILAVSNTPHTAHLRRCLPPSPRSTWERGSTALNCVCCAEENCQTPLIACGLAGSPRCAIATRQRSGSRPKCCATGCVPQSWPAGGGNETQMIGGSMLHNFGVAAPCAGSAAQLQAPAAACRRALMLPHPAPRRARAHKSCHTAFIGT